MDDQNKKNDYDDFFKPAGRGKDDGDDGNGDSANRAHEEKHEEGETGQSSYYYSYGPFKPGMDSSGQDERGGGTGFEPSPGDAPQKRPQPCRSHAADAAGEHSPRRSRPRRAAVGRRKNRAALRSKRCSLRSWSGS